MKKWAVQAVMFDLDGTLIDTLPDLHQAMCATLREMGLNTLSRAEVGRHVGRGMVNLVYRCLTAAHAGVAPEPQVWDAGVSLFRAHYRETNGTQARVFPGVMETLRALSWAGLPMACVTNKPAEFSGRLLEKMGLADFFQTLISGDSLPLKKPDPLPLLTACAQLAVPPSQTLMVGDSEPDIAAARAAGCPVFCVSFGYNEGKPVEAASCDLLLDDFSQVLAHIDAPGLCALSGAA